MNLANTHIKRVGIGAEFFRFYLLASQNSDLPRALVNFLSAQSCVGPKHT